MIIILADKQDKQAQLLYKAIINRMLEVLWISPNEKMEFSASSDGNAYILLDDDKLINNLDNFFINRLPFLQLNHPLEIFLNFIPYSLIMTHPTVESKFLSKLEQLKYIKFFPEIIVLRGEINKFKINSLNTCVKSISHIRSTVRKSSDPAFYNEGLNFMPVQFQNIINGVYIKSHLIGEKIFSYCFNAITLDPRESKYQIKYIETSDIIKNIVLNIKKKIGINYFDCDIICNKKKIYILEINSSPAPLVFEDESKVYIVADELVNFIAQGKYCVEN
jgi:hypothetical protein